MKNLLFTFMLMVFGFGLFAAPVSMETAQQVAVNLYKHYATKTTDYTIADSWANQYNGMTTYYVFTFNAGGFVMVAADDASTPILGYSTDNNFGKENIPSNIQWWFDDYSRQITAIVNANVDNSITKKEWKKIQNNQFTDSKSVTAVSPLLGTIAWNQSGSWNNSCPLTGSTHDPAGCVAVATGQVMKFWGYPATGSGGTYYDWQSGTSTVYNINYNTETYNWAGMSATAASTGAENALYQIGVAVSMQYASSGSGASQADIPRAVIENFKYQPTAEIQTYSNFSNADWIAMLENELNYGRPVLYAGVSGTEGHSFVFDGWQASSPTFHVNWGWGGTSNGYFNVGSLNPTGYTFNSDNQAVIRVQPMSNAPIANFTSDVIAPAVSAPVTFTDLSTNSPTTWTWTFEGGSPSTYSGQTPPSVTYATAGKYLVSLTVTNTNGSDTKTVSKMINVGGTPSAWIKEDLGYPKTNIFNYRMVSGIALPPASTCSACNEKVAWATIIDAGAATHYINEFALTKNGGTTWTYDTVKFTNSYNYEIANISPIDSLTAFAAMFPVLSTYGGVIVKTTDGGQTWTQLAASPSYTTSWLDFVYFFDALHGVSVGDATSSSTKFVIYKTSDGGGTWTQVTPPACITTGGTYETAYTNDYSVIGDTLWYGTSQGRVYKSVDMGSTWTVVATGLGTASQVTPSYRSGNVGYVIGLQNASPYAYVGVQKTTTGGTSYSTVTPTGFYVKNPILAPIPGSAPLWIDGTGGYGLGSGITNNDCSSFTNIDTGSVAYTAVKFYDINAGWAGSLVSNTNAGIFKWNPAVITGIDNPKTDNGQQINIYPNPTNNFVNVEFTGITDKALVSVYNLVGEKVLSTNYNPSNGLLKLDLSANEAGIYFVTIDTGNNIFTKRIMLVK